MVKKRKIMTGIGALIVALILALGSVAFTACGKGEETPPETNTGKDGLISFEVYMQPSRTEYYIGESFDPSGMVLKAGYDDGTVKNVLYSDCTYSADPLGEGDTYVDIEYNGLSVRIDITVTVRPEISDDVGTPEIVEITLERGPEKTSYIRGEIFDPTGMVIKAVYDDGFTLNVPVSETTYDKQPLLPGTESVTVSYGEFSVDIGITVSKYHIDIPDGENRVYRGEAESTDLSTIEITASWAAGKSVTEASAYASGGIMLANLSATEGYLEYYINSATECTATLSGYFMWGSDSDIKLDGSFKLQWNGETFKTNATVSVGSWTKAQIIDLATVPIKAGENVLRIEPTGACPNFDCFELNVNDPDGELENNYDVNVSGSSGRYTVEAENCTVSGTPANGEGKQFTETDGSKVWLSNLGTLGNKITIKIYSDSAKTVDFIVSTAFGHVDYESVEFESSFSSTLGGSPISLTGSIPKTAWTTFEETTAGTINLEQGVNVLVLTVKNGLVPNIDYFAFEDVATPSDEYDVDVSGSDGRYTVEAEDCAVSGTPANGEGKQFTETDGSKVWLSNLGTAGNTVTIRIYSDSAKMVDFIASTAFGHVDYDSVKFESAFSSALGGSPISLTGSIPKTAWTTFEETTAGTINLEQGVNVLVLTVKSGLVPNIDYFAFEDVALPPADFDVDVSGSGGRYTVEAENCAVGGTPANNKDTFIEEGGGKTWVACLGTKGNTVTVDIYSDGAKSVDVYMALAYGKTDGNITYPATFDATLNGAAVTLEGEIGMTGGWHVSQEIKACTLDLSEGVNRLVLTVKALLVPNIDYFVFTDAAGGEST